MRTHDVVVVGGGPAGSTEAGALRRSGMNVILLDKCLFPRDKVCAGWITLPVLAATGLDIDDYRRQATAQPLRSFALGLERRPTVQVDYGHVVGYGIRRCEFDDHLLRQAQVPLLLGTPANSIRRVGESWVLNEEIRAPLLIGAGGHFCPVARHLGAAVGRDEGSITAQEIEFEVQDDESTDGDAPQAALYFCEDLKGYGWRFRKGRYLNIGYGREQSHGLTRSTQDFWSWLVDNHQAPAGMNPRFHGHAYLSRAQSRRPLVGDGALLVGDAAGLADAVSGEGIRPAIESALLAAEVIVAAGGCYSRSRLAGYADLIEQRFGPPGTARRFPISQPIRHFAVRMLMKSTWFARHIILDRGFLHTHSPVLRNATPGAAGALPLGPYGIDRECRSANPDEECRKEF